MQIHPTTMYLNCYSADIRTSKLIRTGKNCCYATKCYWRSSIRKIFGKQIYLISFGHIIPRCKKLSRSIVAIDFKIILLKLTSCRFWKASWTHFSVSIGSIEQQNIDREIGNLTSFIVYICKNCVGCDVEVRSNYRAKSWKSVADPTNHFFNLF